MEIQDKYTISCQIVKKLVEARRKYYSDNAKKYDFDKIQIEGKFSALEFLMTGPPHLLYYSAWRTAEEEMINMFKKDKSLKGFKIGIPFENSPGEFGLINLQPNSKYPIIKLLENKL